MLAHKQDPSNNEPPKSLVQNIGFTEKVAYGSGDLASNLVWTSLGMYIVFFYTDIIGIAAGVIGTIMLISRLLDGLSDIGMGILVDKTKTRNGKSRPWLLWMALPFAALTVLVFSVPDAGTIGTVGQIVYVIITYNLLILLYTAINIPYGVLNSMMSQDQYQRSVLNIFRMAFGVIGALIVSVLTLPVVNALGADQSAWQLTYLIFGAIGILLFLFCYAKTKERVEYAEVHSKDIPVKVGLKALTKNKYWFVVLLFFVATNLGTALGQGTTIFYAQYILGNQGLVPLISTIGIIPILVGFLFMAPVVKRFGKRNTMIFGLVLVLIGSVILIIDPTSLTLVLVSGVIKSLGTAPVVGTMFAMLADTIEYGEWKTGIRTEGIVYSAGSFGAKVGTGIGAALIGWVLQYGGYVGGQADQTDGALFSIIMLFIYIPIIITIIQLVLLAVYKLDKIFPEIVKELQTRGENNA